MTVLETGNLLLNYYCCHKTVSYLFGKKEKEIQRILLLIAIFQHFAVGCDNERKLHYNAISINERKLRYKAISIPLYVTYYHLK